MGTVKEKNVLRQEWCVHRARTTKGQLGEGWRGGIMVNLIERNITRIHNAQHNPGLPAAKEKSLTPATNKSIPPSCPFLPLTS